MTRTPRTLKGPAGFFGFAVPPGSERVHELAVDLDQEMHRLQRGGTAMMMSSNLIKATELAAERKKLADERDRLAGGMAQAESPELEPEDGRRRGPRR